MKKYYSLIIIFTSALFIIIGYLVFTRYIAPTYRNYQTRTETITLNEDVSLTLVKDPKQKNIYSIELEFTGRTNDNFTYQLSESSSGMGPVGRVKGGEIDHVFVNVWYADTCVIRILSPSNDNGELTINYRFFSME